MQTGRNLMLTLLGTLMVLNPVAQADPCGMVPPIWLGDGAPIVRVGEQSTYVFFKDGIETFVIRPGFSGKADEFGMLIPFPSPPAIRKVADEVFGHVGAAIDPPEVVIDLNYGRYCEDSLELRASKSVLAFSAPAAEAEVIVLREEAVGMYEVAVLAAGSAAALKTWMDEHGFQYPQGMDGVCEEYVEDGWCFVAVKARVGNHGASVARPGMREVDVGLPAGATFDGHVQAMGFRFYTEELVLPMRLSTFNEGDLHNAVYVLTDEPKRIRDIDERFVVRQVSGKELWHNLTQPLPLRVIGGELKDAPEWRLTNLDWERNPGRVSGIARELFASDLLAARMGRLAHPHEEDEKALLDIAEELGLRGPEIDLLNRDALKQERDRIVTAALHDLVGMTLTVIEGDFPREVLANDNLHFDDYELTASVSEKRQDGTAGGSLVQLPRLPTPGSSIPVSFGLFALGCALLGAMGAAQRKNRLARLVRVGAAVLVTAGVTAPVWAHRPCLPDTVGALLEKASGGDELIERGRAIVRLSEIGGEPSRAGLNQLFETADSPLVRTWAAAALVRTAGTIYDLAEMSNHVSGFPALRRPITTRWNVLLSEDTHVPVERVLTTLVRVPMLQQDLIPACLQRGVDAFVPIMLGAENTNVRNLAAACLATLAGQGQAGVPQAVTEALRFDPHAVRVPWQGGALFVPGLAWTPDDARDLAGALVAWHLWCDLRGKTGEQAQIHNNLRSLGLANAAGYVSPGWQEVGTGAWLLVWGQAVGAEELERLLAEQGVSREPRFAILLSKLEGQ